MSNCGVKRWISLVMVSLVSTLLPFAATVSAADPVVNFPGPHLQAAIRQPTNIPYGGIQVPGVVLHAGYGTATLDGIMSPGEWDSAGHLDFTVNLPWGGTTPATVFAMNDNVNLYLAVRWARDHLDKGNSVGFEFDNDHSGGARANGDDVFVYSFDAFSDKFTDGFRTITGQGPADTSDRGTNDGAGAFSNDGTFTFVELSHPLDSADDLHDFSVGPGDTLGFTLFVRMIDGDWPSGFGDTGFPTSNVAVSSQFGDLVISAPGRPPTPVPPRTELGNWWLIGTIMSAAFLTVFIAVLIIGSRRLDRE